MRVVLIALAVLFVLFWVWYFLGSPVEQAGAATDPVAVPAPAGAVDTATTTTTVATGALSTLSTATVSSCPSYIVTSDPATGGSVLIDQCQGGQLSSTVGYEENGGEASSAAYGRCKTIYRRVEGKNAFGWTMVWARLGKYWCWRNGKITYKPTTSWDHGVTSKGSLLQWDDNSTIEKATWNSPDNWESHSWATQKFKRCLPAPWGCIKVDDANLTAHIHAYGNGSYRYGA